MRSPWIKWFLAALAILLFSWFIFHNTAAAAAPGHRAAASAVEPSALPGIAIKPSPGEAG